MIQTMYEPCPVVGSGESIAVYIGQIIAFVSNIIFILHV